MNVVNPMRASVADQNAVFNQLEAAHVHVIRCGISNDESETSHLGDRSSYSKSQKKPGTALDSLA